MTEHEFDRNEIATPEQLPDLESQATPMPPSAINAAVRGLEQPAVPPVLENPAQVPPPAKPASGEPVEVAAAKPHAGDRSSEPPGEVPEPGKRRGGRQKLQAPAQEVGSADRAGARISKSEFSPPSASESTKTGMPPADPNDFFSPENIRLAQEIAPQAELVTFAVEVRKPPNDQMIRVHPDATYSPVWPVIEFEEIFYLVAPEKPLPRLIRS